MDPIRNIRRDLHGSELLAPPWYRIFAPHGWWARFVTNIIRWHYRGSGLRRSDSRIRSAPKKGKLRFTYKYYSKDPDFWKHQEAGLFGEPSEDDLGYRGDVER